MHITGIKLKTQQVVVLNKARANGCNLGFGHAFSAEIKLTASHIHPIQIMYKDGQTDNTQYVFLHKVDHKSSCFVQCMHRTIEEMRQIASHCLDHTNGFYSILNKNLGVTLVSILKHCNIR